MRPNTERPITVSEGTNRLCSIENVEELAGEMLKVKDRHSNIPEYWDGNTAARVVNSIKKAL